MIKRIVVPLDGSEQAEIVLPYAEENAGRLNAELILVSARETSENRSQRMLQCYLEQMAQVSKTNAESYQEKPGEKPVVVTTKILSGNPAEEIISFAENVMDSKIMMATHGQSGFTRWSLGSVADKVVRATNRPIALIRARGSKLDLHPKGILGQILVPIDGSRESEVVLPYIEEFAPKMKARVTLLQVFNIEGIVIGLEEIAKLESYRKSLHEYMARLTNNLKKQGIEANYEIIETHDGDVANEINKYTERNYTDTIVMSTHGHSGPRKWVLGSVTNKVLREGNSPITLIRTPGPYKS